MNLDRRAIVAIVLCVLVLIFYQPLLRLAGLGRYLEPPARAPAVEVEPAPADSGPAPPGRAGGERSTLRGVVPDAGPPGARPGSGELIAPPVIPSRAELERALILETPLYRAEFQTRGARLVSVELKHYASGLEPPGPGGARRPPRPGAEVTAERRVVLAGGPCLALDLGSAASLRSLADVNYAAEESLDAAGAVRAVTFTAAGPEGLRLRQTYRVRPDSYALDLEVELVGLPLAWRLSDYSITTRSWLPFTEADHHGDQRMLRASSLVGTNIHREHVGGLRKGPRTFDGNVAWAGVQSRYFLGAVAIAQRAARGVISSADRYPLSREQRRELPADAPADQWVAVNSLVASLPTESQPVNRFVVYFGPSEYRLLAGLGHGLDRTVDLGWAWLEWFSRWLLLLLNWIHVMVRNYGVAILILATVVRVVLHPLNMASIKSMRAMQKLQPEMERIRAKFKNDPQAMNAAVMALYKQHKVNPAGGCLPLLMQMPLFIALYQVLFNAIELRQAPFVLWIDDLSAPDELFAIAGFPIRLLPILMAVTGLLQQRLTPTDPRQAPMMYLMNVFMLVFFYNLPSGLVLYWTVMNVLTALQQILALRHDGRAPAAAAAPATEPEAVRRGRGRRARQAVVKRAPEK